jgi:hypothetical protein
MTALTLTDGGAAFQGQPNRLWFSRSEAQQNHTRHVSPQMNNVSISRIEQGVREVLNVATSTPPTVTPANPALPATSMSPSKHTGALFMKAMKIIAEVERQTRDTDLILTVHHNFDCYNVGQVSQLRSVLEKAASQVDSGVKSLELIRRQEPEVMKRKDQVLAILRETDARVSLLGALLPVEKKPVFYDTCKSVLSLPIYLSFLIDCLAYIYDNRMEHLDTIAQVVILLGIVCSLVMGLSRARCDFIIGVVTLITKMALATHLKKDATDYDGYQTHILGQLPTSLYTALSRFQVESRSILYAVCPVCNFTYKPTFHPNAANANYPSQCTNRIPGPSRLNVCNTQLLEKRNGSTRPIKPFLAASFSDYLARLLQDAEVERLCDKACDDAFLSLNHRPHPDVQNVFGAEFMKNFEGPVPGQLFIDRRGKVRLAFVMFTDFFNPNGSRKRGNHDSIGIIALANLNLPESLRYKPENMFLAGIIPGPREPEKAAISYFLRQVIDECVVAWERGIHISKTASQPLDGRDVEAAIVISVNDLPAARKVSGTAGHNSAWYCTVCSCFGRETLYNTDFDSWKRRDVAEMRRSAEAWRDAETSQQREQIFKQDGVRWSELWRLPYWDPTRMLVVDSMHCLLEGLVHYHCRYVLELDTTQAKVGVPKLPAFSHAWVSYNTSVPREYWVRNDKEIQQISELHDLLVLPFESGPDSFSEEELNAKLLRKHLLPLKFLCYSLRLDDHIVCAGHRVPAKTKKHFACMLINWVRVPSYGPAFDVSFLFLSNSAVLCHWLLIESDIKLVPKTLSRTSNESSGRL